MKRAHRRYDLPTLAALVVCAAMAAPLPAWAQMQEGNWEVTMKMEIADMPMAMPPIKTNQCVTKKDVVPDMSQRDQNCIVKDQKVSGDTVTWKLTCKSKDSTIDGDGRITYAGKTYDGAMNARMTDPSGRAMAVKYTMQGKHTGPCTADSKKAKRADDY
jgi:hypothetical protein